MPSRLSPIEDVLTALTAGGVVVVMDDEDRENEGDFICAAEKINPDIVNFFITHGRGVLCAPILPETAERLDLPPMVRDNTCPHETAFTVAVDHISAKTGITTAERAKTIASLADPRTKTEDLVRPGHIYPLVAKEGGVLRRAGHTEASIDLVKMAGLTPAAALCEILNEGGDRAQRDELYEIAKKYQLPITTIEELIRYRRRSEKLVHREAEANLPTKYGVAKIIAYSVKHESQEPVVLVYGEPSKAENPLVRLHSSCFTGDLVGSLRCDCGDQLDKALSMISEAGNGVLVYLPQEGRGIGLTEKIKAYNLQDQGLDTVDANLELGHASDSRDYGVGIQILKDLGLSSIRLLTNNSKKTDAFIYGGYDLQVTEQVPIVTEIHEHNRQYLETKRDRMGHDLPES